MEQLSRVGRPRLGLGPARARDPRGCPRWGVCQIWGDVSQQWTGHVAASKSFQSGTLDRLSGPAARQSVQLPAAVAPTAGGSRSNCRRKLLQLPAAVAPTAGGSRSNCRRQLDRLPVATAGSRSDCRQSVRLLDRLSVATAGPTAGGSCFNCRRQLLRLPAAVGPTVGPTTRQSVPTVGPTAVPLPTAGSELGPAVPR